MQDFPNTFAVLRRLSTRGSHWQFFEANYNENQNAYEVKTPSWETNVTHVIDSGILPFQENAVRFVRIQLPNGSVRQVIFWFVPVLVDTGVKDRIPVIDFSFKAWLPRPSHRIRAEYINEITQTMESLERRFSSLSGSISYIPDDNEGTPSLPIRPPTPPRQRSRSSTPPQTDSDDETQSIITVYPNQSWLGSPRRLEFPPLPPSPTDDQRVPLPIPEHVGKLLMDHARGTGDSCPITAVPFKEISNLTVTSCFHIFDSQALNRWRQEHTSCPVCRTMITNVVTK